MKRVGGSYGVPNAAQKKRARECPKCKARPGYACSDPRPGAPMHKALKRDHRER